jgi:hypothetical protein
MASSHCCHLDLCVLGTNPRTRIPSPRLGRGVETSISPVLATIGLRSTIGDDGVPPSPGTPSSPTHGVCVCVCLSGTCTQIFQADYRYVAREELRKLGGRQQWAALYAPDAPRGVELRTRRHVATVAGDGACRTLFVHAGTQSARSLPSSLTLTFSLALTQAGISFRVPSRL